MVTHKKCAKYNFGAPLNINSVFCYCNKAVFLKILIHLYDEYQTSFAYC